MPDELERYYDAQATALEGYFTLPLVETIYPQAAVKLPAQGGYVSRRSCGYRLESVLSFESAYTQVAGNREVKEGHGYSTLATAVVEGLNVLEVVTADRVVAQVSTEHPLNGRVPSITFLGTRFENLRIAGHKVDLDLNLDIFGEKPEGDLPYTQSSIFVENVVEQHARIREGQSKHGGLFAELLDRYNRVPESFATRSGDEETVECSLVNQAEGSYPGRGCGHVIDVPHFGKIYLGVLRLSHRKFEDGIPALTALELTMIDIRMGCVGAGGATASTLKTNGMPGKG